MKILKENWICKERDNKVIIYVSIICIWKKLIEWKINFKIGENKLL